MYQDVYEKMLSMDTMFLGLVFSMLLSKMPLTVADLD
jgi:hypothetical protein